MAKHREADPFVLPSSTIPFEASALVTCKKEANKNIIIAAVKFFNILRIIGYFGLKIKFRRLNLLW